MASNLFLKPLMGELLVAEKRSQCCQRELPLKTSLGKLHTPRRNQHSPKQISSNKKVTSASLAGSSWRTTLHLLQTTICYFEPIIVVKPELKFHQRRLIHPVFQTVRAALVGTRGWQIEREHEPGAQKENCWHKGVSFHVEKRCRAVLCQLFPLFCYSFCVKFTSRLCCPHPFICSFFIGRRCCPV